MDIFLQHLTPRPHQHITADDDPLTTTNDLRETNEWIKTANDGYDDDTFALCKALLGAQSFP